MRRRQAFLLILAVALLSQAGCEPAPTPFQCTDAIGCVEIGPGDPIRIGVLQVLSGGMALSGQELLQSVELAAAERGDELLGHPLELQSADDQCSAEGGTTAALQFAADPQVVGIVGPTCSGAAAAAMEVFAKAGLVLISGSSSSSSLTSVGGERGSDWQPGFFRTAPNDALSGRSAATFAFEVLGVRRAATIDDGGTYTRGFTDAFKRAFTELGGQVVLAAAINKGDTDMRPVLTAVAMSGAELLFFTAYSPEMDRIVLQARAMDDLDNVTLMTGEAYYDSFLQAVGEAGVGLYFNGPAPPEGPAYDAFVAQYEATYGEPPIETPYHAQTYDAANLLFHAVEAVAVQEKDGTLHIGRQALRDALYTTSGFPGLTGSLTCTRYGDCGVARFNVARLDDPAAGLRGLEANVVYTWPPEQ
jgi:branched-chain amino acid transport system substrate-binding protein